jgi:hypothetical protein
MRSILAIVAAVIFFNAAMTFMPAGYVVWLNEGAAGGIDGDPGAVAVTWAVRTLSWGLMLLALAAVEWDKAIEAYRRGQRTRMAASRSEAPSPAKG